MFESISYKTSFDDERGNRICFYILNHTDFEKEISLIEKVRPLGVFRNMTPFVIKRVFEEYILSKNRA